MEHQIHYTGAMDVRCQFCGALRFQREQLNCCHNGKVLLPPLQEYPENLRLLFDADGAEGSNFLCYIICCHTTFPSDATQCCHTTLPSDATQCCHNTHTHFFLNSVSLDRVELFLNPQKIPTTVAEWGASPLAMQENLGSIPVAALVRFCLVLGGRKTRPACCDAGRTE
ncbi:hypothetical protein FHG87_023690 [Trinorchestia longiramus]|nr:hypothetical protein FHG87_023690 [Trinorchestia longiramus]